MKEFDYTVQDELGLHARPAGLLVKSAVKYKSSIKLSAKGKEADCKRLFAVMGLAIKRNDVIHFVIDGEDEDLVHTELRAFCEANF